MARSTYWVGQYRDGADGGPIRESGGLTYHRARRLEEEWDDRRIGFSLMLREGPDGKLYEIRGRQSSLPEPLAESLRDQGFEPLI